MKRENRRFSPTPAGELFYRGSLVLMADFDWLLMETKKAAGGEEFTLRIGYIKGYGGGEFQRAVIEFAGKYPDIPVEVKNGNHENLYGMLRNEQVDLVLNDQRRAFSDEHVNTVLTVFNCYIKILARNPIANLESVNASDLRYTSRILVAAREQEENERGYFREVCGIESDFLFADNLEETRLMVVSGKGSLPIEEGSHPPQLPRLLEGGQLRILH